MKKLNLNLDNKDYRALKNLITLKYGNQITIEQGILEIISEQIEIIIQENENTKRTKIE